MTCVQSSKASSLTPCRVSAVATMRHDVAAYTSNLDTACIMTGPTHTALVQVKFSADGNFLYTGARKDPEILCWDVRYTSDVVYRLQRNTADTNQRIHFDIEPMGRHLSTGEFHCLLYHSQTG